MEDQNLDLTEKTTTIPHRVPVDSHILRAARLPFAVAIIGLLAMLFIYSSQTVLRVWPTLPINENDTAFARFLIPNAPYLLLSVVSAFAAYIGYRLTVAAGATRNPVIPPEDYALLSPLVRDGKSESIDQYVRLSSLTKFTGTFTQLGLSGLPLATIFLTLFFSFMTIFSDEGFLDLTKLTLGAFIGSFVQRHIERRNDTGGKSIDPMKQ